jgi:hypothetical protein
LPTGLTPPRPFPRPQQTRSSPSPSRGGSGRGADARDAWLSAACHPRLDPGPIPGSYRGKTPPSTSPPPVTLGLDPRAHLHPRDAWVLGSSPRKTAQRCLASRRPIPAATPHAVSPRARPGAHPQELWGKTPPSPHPPPVTPGLVPRAHLHPPRCMDPRVKPEEDSAAVFGLPSRHPRSHPTRDVTPGLTRGPSRGAIGGRHDLLPHLRLSPSGLTRGPTFTRRIMDPRVKPEDDSAAVFGLPSRHPRFHPTRCHPGLDPGPITRRYRGEARPSPPPPHVTLGLDPRAHPQELWGKTPPSPPPPPVTLGLDPRAHLHPPRCMDPRVKPEEDSAAVFGLPSRHPRSHPTRDVTPGLTRGPSRGAIGGRHDLLPHLRLSPSGLTRGPTFTPPRCMDPRVKPEEDSAAVFGLPSPQPPHTRCHPGLDPGPITKGIRKSTMPEFGASPLDVTPPSAGHPQS